MTPLPGFYRGGGGELNFKSVVEGKWEPWNRTVDIVMKPIIKPIPMYARKVGEPDAVKIPEKVARSAHAAFAAIAAIESAIHGVAPDELHLHEVGAVDAILDIVGSIWGVELLGIERIYNTKVALGDGTVKTAHGVLPVPAPATIRLLEGFNVRHGPPGSGELTTRSAICWPLANGALTGPW